MLNRLICITACLLVFAGCQRPIEEVLLEHAKASAEGKETAATELEKQLFVSDSPSIKHKGKNVLDTSSQYYRYLMCLQMQRVSKLALKRELIDLEAKQAEFQNTNSPALKLQIENVKSSIEGSEESLARRNESEFATFRTNLLRGAGAPETLVNLSLREAQWYCELRFGSEAPERVILGISGEVCFVYRKGDLSSAPEKYNLTDNNKTNLPDFDFGSGVTYSVESVKRSERNKYQLQLYVQGDSAASGERIFRQSCIIDLSHSPTKMSYGHFGGPLEITALSPPAHSAMLPKAIFFRLGGASTRLTTNVGTFNVEEGCATYVESHKEFSGLPPIAKIQFPTRDGQASITKEYLLDQKKYVGEFYKEIVPPDGVVAGTAKATISFDKWPKVNVAPSTFEVPVLPAQ